MGIKSIISAMTLKTKIIIICATVAVVGGVGAVLGVTLTKEDAYRVIKVFEMTGDAVVTRANTGDLDAYVGMNLESGDTLTVGEDSTLRISMDSDKYVLLDGGTVLELTATGSASDSRTVINLKQGTILNELTNPLSANSSYEISTPKSTMAVRGTSFIVSVEEQSDGSFITTESTLQGKVEVELLDKDGNPTGNTALVTPDTSVTILTEPDETSGNPADEDGTSSFVKEGEDGTLVPVGDDESPLHNINYDNIPDLLRGNAIRSNDSNLMILNDIVMRKLRGEEEPEETTVTTSETTTETTTAPVTTETVDIPPTTVATQATFPTETTTEETTVPEETTVTTVETTVPEETTTEVTVPTETTVPEETTTDSSTSSSTTTEETTTTPAATGSVIFKFKDGRTETIPNLNAGDSVTLPAFSTGNKWKYDGSYYNAGYTFTYDANYGDSVTFTEVTLCRIDVQWTDGATFLMLEEGESLLSILESTYPSNPTINIRMGWIFDNDGTKIDSSSVVTGSAKVKEVTAEIVTVTFYNGANVYAIEKVAKGYSFSAIGRTIPAVPENTGFTGIWSNDGGTTEFDSGTVVSSDIDLRPHYTKSKYTVSFSASDCDDPAAAAASLGSIMRYHGDTIGTLPTVPTKTGNTGVWTVDGEEIDSSYIVTYAVTVYAKYTPEEYNITYSAPGTTDTSWNDYSESLDYGRQITSLPTVPEKTGYEGVWTIDGSEVTVDFDHPYIVRGDVTFTVKYTEKEYYVLYYYIDSDIPGVIDSSDWSTQLKYSDNILARAPTSATAWEVKSTTETGEEIKKPLTSSDTVGSILDWLGNPEGTPTIHVWKVFT